MSDCTKCGVLSGSERSTVYEDVLKAGQRTVNSTGVSFEKSGDQRIDNPPSSMRVATCGRGWGVGLEGVETSQSRVLRRAGMLHEGMPGSRRMTACDGLC